MMQTMATKPTKVDNLPQSRSNSTEISQMPGDTTHVLKDNATDEDETEIEEFIKGVEAAIDTSGGKINRNLAHLTFVGPPGSGKSSLMDRLLGRLRKKLSTSTGVCDSIVIVDINVANPSTFCSATIVDCQTWEETECDASFVRQMREQNTSTRGLEGASISSDYQVEAQPLSIESSDRPAKSTASSLSVSHQPSNVIADISEAMEGTSLKKSILQFVLKKYGFEKFKKCLEKTCSLYLRDTGGQVEFQEMLALLISGPSIFIFVFRADLDLKGKFEVQYRKSSSESLNSYTSSITTEEALLQSLTSVYAMDTSNEDTIKAHQPLVFIIGTHIDKLGCERESKIYSLNQHLDSIIKSNGFSHLVQYADERKGHVMFAVDNTSENEESFQLIRSRVNSLIIKRKEFNIEYPISYLLFGLDLQNIKKSVLTLDECRELAASHGITGDQVLHLLRFLHLRIGLIRYYNVEGLRHLVIIEPQVLFNRTTDLIAITFSIGTLLPGEVTDLEKKGILSARAFESLESFSDKISATEFLQLLVHLRITAPFCVAGDREKRYFIPCVLNHVPESTEEDSETAIAPLCVKFKCNHCPKGIYGVLVTYLMRPEREDHNTTFILLEDKIFKDQVSFEVDYAGVLDKISLKLFSSYIEIKIFPEQSEFRTASVTNVCSNIRQTIEKSILRSLKDLHYKKEKVGPVMCLRCEHCSELHEVQKRNDYHLLQCRKSHKTNCIPFAGRCWYNIEDSDTGYVNNHERSSSSQSSSVSRSTPLPPECSRRSEIASTGADCLEESFSSVTVCVEKKPLKLSVLLKELLPLASEWHNIGTLLDIPEGELQAIRGDNPHNMKDCLREMTSTWLRKADPEPTWEGLVEAVEVIDQKKAQDIKSKYL